MSVEMPLNEDHEVLGSEFCSGYSDALGRWNPGFYCPPGGGGREDASDALFCCGGATYKYCCTQREHATAEDLGNLPLVLGAALGATAALAIIILVCCCCCSCCSLHKSRNSSKQANDGPVYRMQTSSTASGVANMYSFSNQNSLATTPIDTAASQIMVELEPGSVGRSGTMGRGNTFCASGARTLQRNGGHDPPPPYDAGKSAHHTLPHQRHHHHHQQQQQPQHPQHLYPPDGLPQPPHQHQPQAQAQGRQHFTLPRSHGMQSARSPITTFPQGPSQGFAAHQAHPTATLSRVPRAVPASVPVVPVALVRPPPGPMPPGPPGPTSPAIRSPVDSPHRGFQTHTLRHPPSNAVPLNASGYGMTHSTSSTFQPCPPLQQQQPPPQQQQQQHPKQHLSQGIVGLPPPPSIPAPVPMGPPMGPMPPMGQPGGPLVGHPKGVATNATTPLGPPANAPVPATTNGGPGHMNGSTGCELSPGDTLYRSTKF